MGATIIRAQHPKHWAKTVYWCCHKKSFWSSIGNDPKPSQKPWLKAIRIAIITIEINKQPSKKCPEKYFPLSKVVDFLFYYNFIHAGSPVLSNRWKLKFGHTSQYNNFEYLSLYKICNLCEIWKISCTLIMMSCFEEWLTHEYTWTLLSTWTIARGSHPTLLELVCTFTCIEWRWAVAITLDRSVTRMFPIFEVSNWKILLISTLLILLLQHNKTLWKGTVRKTIETYINHMCRDKKRPYSLFLFDIFPLWTNKNNVLTDLCNDEQLGYNLLKNGFSEE